MKILPDIGINRKLIKSVGLLGVSNIIAQAIAFVTSIFLAWTLSKSDYGYFRYVIQVGNFIVMFIAAGYAGALTRFIAAERKKRNAYFSTAMAIVGIILILLFPLFLILHIDLLVYVVIVGYSIPMIYNGIIRGFIDYRKIALFNILRSGLKLLFVSLIFVFSFLKTPLYIIGVYSFGGWLGIFILETWRKTDIHLYIKGISKKILITLTRFSIFSVLSSVFYSSLITVGVIILKQNYGYEVVAEYSMAVTLTTIYSFVPGAVNTLLMPKVASVSSEKRIRFLKYSILLNVSYIFFVYILVIVFGRWGLQVLFEEKYLGAYPFLVIISIGKVFGGVETAFGAFWGGVNKPEYGAISVGVAAGVNLLSDFFLINIIGSTGVAWGYSFALLSTVLTNLVLYNKYRSSMIFNR